MLCRTELQKVLIGCIFSLFYIAFYTYFDFYHDISGRNVGLLLLGLFLVFISPYFYEGRLTKPSLVIIVKFIIFYVFAAYIYVYSYGFDYSTSSVYVLLGVVCFTISYKFYEPKYLRYFRISVDWSVRRVLVAFFFLYMCGLAAYVYYIKLSGGFYNYFITLNNRSYLAQGKGPLVSIIYYFLPASVILLFVYIINFRKKSVIWWLLFLVTYVIWLILALLLASRLFFAFQIINLLFIIEYFGRIRKKTFKIALVFISIALLTFILVLTDIRSNVKNIAEGESEIEIKPFLSLLESNLPFCEVFREIVNKVPSQYDFLYGKTYLEALYAPIPRAFWHNKPFGVASEVTYLLYGYRFYYDPYFYYTQTGPDVRLIDESYLNFGVIGIIVMFSLYGFLVKLFEKFISSVSNNPERMLIGGLLFEMFVYRLDGNSFMNINRIVSYILVFVMFIFLLGLRVRRIASN